jgi:hypothetical protein
VGFGPRYQRTPLFRRLKQNRQVCLGAGGRTDTPGPTDWKKEALPKCIPCNTVSAKEKSSAWSHTAEFQQVQHICTKVHRESAGKMAALLISVAPSITSREKGTHLCGCGQREIGPPLKDSNFSLQRKYIHLFIKILKQIQIQLSFLPSWGFGIRGWCCHCYCDIDFISSSKSGRGSLAL